MKPAPTVGEINVFLRKHGYCEGYFKHKDSGISSEYPPCVYVTMPFNYPDEVFVHPTDAFLSLWANREEYAEFLDDDDDELWQELAELISEFQLESS